MFRNRREWQLRGKTLADTGGTEGQVHQEQWLTLRKNTARSVALNE